MNDELERSGEWLWPKILSWQFLGGTEEDHDKPQFYNPSKI